MFLVFQIYIVSAWMREMAKMEVLYTLLYDLLLYYYMIYYSIVLLIYYYYVLCKCIMYTR